MGKFLIILLFLVNFGCSTSEKKKEIAELHLRMGTALLHQGKNPQAIAELRTALSKDPKNPMVHNNLGLAYYIRGEVNLAEQHLNKAVELNPAYSEARNNLSRILSEQSKYKEAIAEADRVIADLVYIHPEKAHLNKGIALFGAKRYEQARESFRTSLGIKRDSCLAQTYYGRALFELGNFEQATKVLDSAVSLCRPQGFDEPHYYSALSYYKLGDNFQARARFNEVIEHYPRGKYTTNSKEMLQLIR